jgi:hypothetical protein
MLDVSRSKLIQLGLGLPVAAFAAFALVAIIPARPHKSIEDSRTALPSAKESKSEESSTERSDDAGDVLLMALPFAKVAAPLDTPDPDELTALFQPPASTQVATINANPRQLRKMVDHAVAAYASASDLATRKKAVTLIQIAALLGYSPARSFLVRNYPASETVRAVVDGADIVAYSIDLFATRAINEKTFETLFLALARSFTTAKDDMSFARYLVDALKADSRPQIAHRLDVIFDLLSRVPGVCREIARVISIEPQPSETSAQECSPLLDQSLRRQVEATRATGHEQERKRRGALMLQKMGQN